MLAHGFLGRIPEDAFGGAIPQGNATLWVDHDDGVLSRVHDAGKLLLALSHLHFRPALFGLVAEDQHRAGDLALLVPDGRAAIGDGALGAVAGQQQRVVGEVHDHPIVA